MIIRKATAALAAPLLATAAFALASEASAQAAATGRADLVRKLSDCRKLADDPARLACYDAAAAALEQAEAKGEIMVVDREQADRVRRQAFGFSLQALNIFDRVVGGEAAGEASQPLDRITTTLTRGHQRGDGRWTLELEDGAVWQQTDDQPMQRANPGATVTIRRAAMGSFFVNVDGQRAIRATRVK